MAGVRDNTITNIVSGGIASFKSVGEVPLKSLKVNFSPIQEGDGDPSPSNVRVIEGWTGLNVFHTGKNLLNPTVPISTQSASNPVVNVNPNGSITVNSRDGTSWFARDYIYLPAGTYDFYSVFGNDYTSRYILDDDNHTEYSWKNKKTVTLTKTTKIRFKAAMGTEYPVTGWLQIFKTEENYGEYLYNGTTVPVSWSDLGTVYGGWCNPITGEGKITHIIMSDTWGNWGTVADQGDGTELRYKKFPYPVKGNSSSNFNTCLCNVAPYNYNNQTGTTHFYVVGNSYNCRIYLPSGTDTNLQIQALGELVTPISFSFTPIEIKTLLGQNNIWSNADSVEVQYCALESLDIYKQRFKTNEPHLQNASGNIVSFQTDMVAPLKECKVYFQPVQASGTPSPDNVLPISGWNELSIYKRNKNLLRLDLQEGLAYPTTSANTTPRTFDMETYIVGMSSQNYYRRNYTNWVLNVSVSNNEVNFSSGGASGYGIAFPLFLIPGKTYTLSAISTNNGGMGFIFYDKDGNCISKFTASTAYPRTTTIPENTWVTLIIFYATTTNTDFSFTDICLSEGSDSINYEQSVGSYNSITLPSTYYGGYLNPLTGVGEIVYKYLHLTGNENWYMEENTSTISNASYLCSIRVEPTGQNSGVYKPAISDKLAPSTYWAPDLYCAVINTTSRVVIGLPQELSTKEAVNNWIQSIGGIDVVWESMFPTSFTFTPINPIKTLKNQNNIWSNTNGITQVKYWTHGSIADKRKVVWNQLAPPLTSDYWNDRSSTETITTFENGIATTQFILLTGSYHTMCTKNSSTTYQNHKYYSRLDCMLNKSVNNIGGDVANIAWSKPFIDNLNEWGTYSTIVTGEQDRNSYIYYPRMTRSGGLQQGTIAKTRNPLVVDLTLMFGAGNEPSTTAEFEALCIKNGINFNTYQSYDITGTEVYWYF